MPFHSRKKAEKPKKAPRYLKAPRKHPVTRILSACVLTAIFAAFAWAVLTVDRNCKAVGWGERRVEFAFAQAGGRAQITVMGRRCDLDFTRLDPAIRVCGRLHTACLTLESPPRRLADMLLTLAMPQFRAAADKIRNDFPRASFFG